ncbi:dihydrolipoamide acetyltransferase family protein [uncultured Jatrophihabitans sp.]|uniref:dihydrolipoamide acetyltransferase family protein n=1 Tax=uncultured Jatrophihabitans sp. TaxID=1610747 RepID=UPI0035CC9114
MTVEQFRLPDLGEGLTEGDILSWAVAVGDTVEVNDTIAEVETVKAAVELPSPYAGVVTALHAAAGETVPVGTPIISIDVGGTDAPAAAADLVPALPTAGGVDDEQQLTLVGYGPREETGRRRRRRPEATVAAAQASFNLPPASAPHPAPEPEIVEPAPVDAGRRVLAKPPVRKLAKELGVDLSTVSPTGPHGTISRADVHAAGRVDSSAPSGQLHVTTRATSDHSRETRVPIKGVRKHTAAAMVASAFTAPHVTEFITVDISATMELRDRVAARREFRDVKVSPLLFVSRAVLRALARTPELNATWDDAAQEIVLKHYVNLGIAAATERGLIVPTIKDAHELTLLDLARAMAELTDIARAGKTAMAALTGGTFTISNVGVFGVDTGTPILNPGESGILAFGAVRRTPWVVGSGDSERIEARWVTQLAVSFDHRIVDGQQGSQFLADVADVLHDPGLALL